MDLVASKPLLARQHPMTQRVKAGDVGAVSFGR